MTNPWDEKSGRQIATLHATIARGVEEFRLETKNASYQNVHAQRGIYEAILVTLRPSIPRDAGFDKEALEELGRSGPDGRVRLDCHVFADWRATIGYQRLAGEALEDLSEEEGDALRTRVFSLLTLKLMEEPSSG